MQVCCREAGLDLRQRSALLFPDPPGERLQLRHALCHGPFATPRPFAILTPGSLGHAPPCRPRPPSPLPPSRPLSTTPLSFAKPPSASPRPPLTTISVTPPWTTPLATTPRPSPRYSFGGKVTQNEAKKPANDRTCKTSSSRDSRKPLGERPSPPAAHPLLEHPDAAAEGGLEAGAGNPRNCAGVRRDGALPRSEIS